jgi:hypothetical protein
MRGKDRSLGYRRMYLLYHSTGWEKEELLLLLPTPTKNLALSFVPIL